MKQIRFVNLTPHVVRIYTRNTPHVIEQGDVETHPGLIVSLPSEGIARVPFEDEEIGEIGGVPVMMPSFLEPSGLREPQEGVVYITSLLVAQNVPGRDDLFAPIHLVRNRERMVVGCRALTNGRYP